MLLTTNTLLLTMAKSQLSLRELFKNDSKNIQNFVPKQNDTIRIMTFNVHNWTDYIGAKSMDNIFKIIAESNADILGINEGMYFQKGSKIQICEYAKLLGYKILECNGKYGINLLLSKYPIESSEVIRLGPDPIQNENRYAIKALININNNLINIMLTHLDVWDETEETRLNQIKIIFSKINSSYILMGDLNSLRKNDYTETEWKNIKANDELRHVKSQHKVTKFIESNGFTDCFVQLGKPCPKVSVWSMRRVDYIYVGNDFQGIATNCGIYPTIMSDHYPMYIDVNINKNLSNKNNN